MGFNTHRYLLLNKNLPQFHTYITLFILISVFLQPLKFEVEYIDVQGI